MGSLLKANNFLCIKSIYFLNKDFSSESVIF